MQFCVLWKRHICLSAGASKSLHCHSDKTTLYVLNCLANFYHFLLDGVPGKKRLLLSFLSKFREIGTNGNSESRRLDGN